ncbi:hypothetical protein [Propioniciclava sinopodophylli]|uniref:hypothetical protein n=1 Tax=Propioniciclava sinopodophylli TaxID=1837344 RepID=UPI00249320D7|nr:hypothetical protein [Propioniciclava sinopodophylli]
MITRRNLLLSTAASGSLLLVAGCTAGGPAPNPSTPPGGPVGPEETPRLDPNVHQVVTRTPAADVVVTPDAAGALAASRALLAAATAVVVLADATPPTPSASASPAASPSASARPSPSASANATPTASAAPAEEPATDPVQVAAGLARELGVPLFVDTPDLAAELDRLQTRTVIAYGTPAHVGGREVIPAPATAAELSVPGLPVAAPAPAALAVVSGEPVPAVLATLAAAGVQPQQVPAPHPGATVESTALLKANPGPVVAVGEGFGTDEQFATQVKVTRTADELPGGGIAPLPGRHMIAFYGHPETAALGMMGEQPPAEAVRRLGRLVDEYRALMPGQTVIGSFEIITTVASAAAGDDGDYSYETPIEKLMPWVEAAEANDIYVVLDLQPGRTGFLEQAKRYEELLLRPTVGLALDPEWRLKPDQKHLRQIGQVHIDEVNEVGAWLADLVAEHELPPKVLTLHQFQTRMIIDRARLDTSRPEVQYLVHVDGQGGQGAKQGTWSVIRRDLPPRVWLGWKNFEDEDIPMLTPKQTVEQVHPTPHFISYQ